MYYEMQTAAAKTHKQFRHYTRMESLGCILRTGLMRLSVLELCNDPVEWRRLEPIKKNKLFVSCFCNGIRESIPMWNIYGYREQGVCLEFGDLSFAVDPSRIVMDRNGWDVRHICIADVLYTEDIGKLEELEDLLGLGVYTKVPQAQGYTKSIDWQHEQETRILVYVDVTKGNPSRNWDMIKCMGTKGNHHPDTFNYPPFSYIYLNIIDQLRDNVIIRINPYVDESTFESYKERILCCCKDFPEQNIRSSELLGLV